MEANNVWLIFAVAAMMPFEAYILFDHHYHMRRAAESYQA